MHYVFASSLLVLHPTMPFLTEELWQAMGYGKETDLIMLGRWPEPIAAATLQGWGITREAADYIEDKHELIRAGRQLRADYNIPPSEKLDFLVKPVSEQKAAWLRGDAASIQALLKASSLTVDPALAAEKAMPSGVVPLGTIYMSVAGHIDVEAEITRLSAQVEKVESDLKRVNAKLENPDFVQKAKPEVVDVQRNKKHELQESAAKLDKLIKTLAGLRKI